MPAVHIDEVYPKSVIYPFVVNFQNGYPSEFFKSRECMVLYDEKTSTKTVATDVGQTLYLGEETDEGLGKTLILARNRVTGKVRLIEAGTIELKPDLKNDLESSQLLDNSALELGRKFGSKKYKKTLEQREKLKQNEQAVVAQMANVSQTLTKDQVDVSQHTQPDSENFYTPPINLDATTIPEVYDIDMILTEKQYETIMDEIETSQFMDTLHPFIKRSMKKDLTPQQKVLAVYASSLFKSYFLKCTDIMKKTFIVCFESITLNKHILENFFTYVSGKRCRPTNYRDKALTYTIVLIFLISDYKFDFDEFCRQTKYAVRTMIARLTMTGGSSRAVDGIRLAVLRFPLSKPVTRRKSSKF